MSGMLQIELPNVGATPPADPDEQLVVSQDPAVLAAEEAVSQ